MRKNLHISILLFLLLHTVSSVAQNIPHGFNYQTTVRDVAGTALVNQLVGLQFSFYSGSASGSLVWQETTQLSTDQYGHLDFVIGTGTSTGAGTATAFDQISWYSNSFYLKVSVDLTGGSSYTDIGTAQLFSVPYAMYSQRSAGVTNIALNQFQDVNLTGISAGKLLKWNGGLWQPAVDLSNDTVLFAWNAGNSATADTSNYTYASPVVDSAVYSHLSDSAEYSINSGSSSVTGNAAHSDTALYALASAPIAWQLSGSPLGGALRFVGTNDAADMVVRTNAVENMRLTSNGNFFIGSSSGAANVNMYGINGLIASGTFASGILPASGAGTRMLWYPFKASFRAGGVTASQWDAANIGNYSFAAGYNSIAGNYAFASGSSCTASGDYAVAIGRMCQATAVGVYPAGTSVAMGDSSVATSTRGIAIGRGNLASVQNATIAIGYNTRCTGATATSFGTNTTASGNNSFVMGYFGSSNSKTGSFVYADASSSSLTSSTINNQFLVRGSGGTVFYTDSLMTMGVMLAPGGGSWLFVSDRNKKENFQSVNSEDILAKITALKITSWNYRSQSQSIRHIGPMAQDFYRLFGGQDALSISGADMDGVILSGIKGLNLRLQNLQIEESIENLKAEVEKLDNSAELNKRLDAIENILQKK